MAEGKPDLALVLRHYGVDVPEHRVTSLVCCPVHEENRPSCSVSLLKQVFSCKACGAAGDSYTLIRLKEGHDSFAATLAFSESVFGVAAPVPPRPSRSGLRGSSRPGRRGWQPRTRRGLRDAEA